MIITYFGGEFIKIQFGDTVLALNPPSRDSKLKASRFGSDIAIGTLNHPDLNGFENVSHGDKKPFSVSGPGEYEVKDVVVRGFATESLYGGEKGINTVYTIILEGMKICFLGALSQTEIPAELKEELDEVDILFVPIGGAGVLSASEAAKLSVSIGPRLIIPMHFAGLGEPNALKNFLKEVGEEKAAMEEKLTIKKKDLEGKEGEVAVLKSVV